MLLYIGEPPMSLITKIRQPRKMAREPEPADVRAEAASSVMSAPTSSPRLQSKMRLVLAMLERAEGATIEALASATGWLPHTTRAALTGLKKKGHAITSEKIDGTRVYRVAQGGNP